MKTNSPNVLFNLQAKFLLEKSSQVMKQKLLMILMLVSFCTGTFAQNARIASQSGNPVLTDVNSLLFTSSGSTAARLAVNSQSGIDVSRVKELVTQVQPSTYFYDGTVKTYGDVPSKLFTDLSSLNRVSSSITLKDNIEIVTVRINTTSELNSTIDLNAFSNFPNLKYIYFITSLNTTSDAIARSITNYDQRYSIMYKIDKGDRNQ